MHAVPVRAGGTVLGVLGLFGTEVGELNAADLLVPQTLAHIAAVAILNEQPATPETVFPRLSTALVSRVVVEQAKGFVRERIGVSTKDAFTLLRRYARANDEHLTAVSRRLMTDSDTRLAIIAAMSKIKTRSMPTRRRDERGLGARLRRRPVGRRAPAWCARIG